MRSVMSRRRRSVRRNTKEEGCGARGAQIEEDDAEEEDE
jgi:hypothetical protein